MPRNADRSLLRLSVRVGEIAVRDSRLVRLEERLDGDRVKIQDLATGESSAVELSSLRGRSAVANGASIDAHLELARASTEATWDGIKIRNTTYAKDRQEIDFATIAGNNFLAFHMRLCGVATA